MLEQFLQFDRDLLIYLNNLGSDNWDLLWLIITDKLTFLPFFLIIIYFIYKKFTIKELLFILLTIALLILFTADGSIVISPTSRYFSTHWFPKRITQIVR